MKRFGNLFQRAFTREALHMAFLVAARGKRGHRSCFEFDKRLVVNLDQLYQELHSGTYQPRPYHKFIIKEPKERTIFAPAFRDLVVQHAIYAVIRDIFEPGFIGESFACQIGKGTHKAADYAQAALQQSPRDSYSLKMDIRKFFYRIDRTILRAQIERKIKDARFTNLLMQFAEYGEPIGIPIGNLLSQTFALIYLNVLDQFVKRVLKIKLYCRYVDDFVLFGLSQQKAKLYLGQIRSFLHENLHLGLSRYTIANVKRGVNFVGYRTWASKRFIRKRSLYSYKAAVTNNNLVSAVSILGHARRTATLRHLLKLTKENNYGLYRSLPKAYHPGNHQGTTATLCRQ